MLKFLDKTNFTPDYIVFVDDKLYHVEAVERAAHSRNINYTGIRYSRCDNHVKEFNPAYAETKLNALRKNNRKTPHVVAL